MLALGEGTSTHKKKLPNQQLTYPLTLCILIQRTSRIQGGKKIEKKKDEIRKDKSVSV